MKDGFSLSGGLRSMPAIAQLSARGRMLPVFSICPSIRILRIAVDALYHWISTVHGATCPFRQNTFASSRSAFPQFNMSRMFSRRYKFSSGDPSGRQCPLARVYKLSRDVFLTIYDKTGCEQAPVTLKGVLRACGGPRSTASGFEVRSFCSTPFAVAPPADHVFAGTR